MTDSKLSTAFVTHADINKAAKELLANALRLAAAGRFADGRNLMLKLLEPGPWKLKKNSPLLFELEEWLPMFSYWCETDCPQCDSTDAMSEQEVVDLAKQKMEQQTMLLGMVERNCPQGIGHEWMQPLIDHLDGPPDVGARNTAFNAFCVDAQGVLAARLRDALKALRPSDESAMEVDDGALIDGMDISRLLWLATPAKVAPAAQAVSSQEIGRATLEYLRRRGLMHTSASIAVVRVAMALSAIDECNTDAAYLAKALMQLDPNDFSWLRMLHFPQVRALFASGQFADTFGVTEASVAALMQAVNSRPEVPARSSSHKPSYFCDTLESFSAILAASPLHGREIVELSVLDTPERAYAMRGNLEDMESEWNQARELVSKTRRWPVVVPCPGGGGGDLRSALVQADLFSRFYFEEAPDANDVSPRAIIDAAGLADVPAFLERQEQSYSEGWSNRIYADGELNLTRHFCGDAPSEQQLSMALLDGEPLSTQFRLDRWLLDWELRHDLSPDKVDLDQEWYDSDSVVLLFLPTPSSWDALGYISWYGASYFGTENYIALGRRWQSKYGAELLYHSGTELRCVVSKPPSGVEDAWALAREHYLASGDTLSLPGISVRHYAMGLMNSDRWQFINKP